jgi:outer membrane lipoprotein-sorting protein
VPQPEASMRLLTKTILSFGLIAGFSSVLGAEVQSTRDVAGFDCRWSLLAAQPASSDLDRVLTSMDIAGKNFKSVQASVVWDEYQKVADDHDVEKGVIYFRREGASVEMAVEFSAPNEKSVLFTGGKLQMYLPKIDQVDEYDPGKHASDVESYLVLGFGGGGHDLLKSYDVTYKGPETVLGTKTEKLELVPKSARFRNDFIASIDLWIDPTRGISVQQQFFQPGGDWRLAKYSDIKSNAKLPDGAFKLKTTKKTKFVSH